MFYTWMVVSRIISCSINLDYRPLLSIFLFPGSSLCAYYHGYHYGFLVDPLWFFKVSVMGLHEKDSGEFLLGLEWIIALTR